MRVVRVLGGQVPVARPQALISPDNGEVSTLEIKPCIGLRAAGRVVLCECTRALVAIVAVGTLAALRVRPSHLDLRVRRRQGDLSRRPARRNDRIGQDPQLQSADRAALP